MAWLLYYVLMYYNYDILFTIYLQSHLYILQLHILFTYNYNYYWYAHAIKMVDVFILVNYKLCWVTQLAAALDKRLHVLYIQHFIFTAKRSLGEGVTIKGGKFHAV